MNKKKIYVAGPLNAMAVDYLKNVSNMMTEAEHLRRLGFSVYVPAIDLLMGIKFNYTDYNDYFDNSQPWLLAADALYVCKGWQNSEGTQKEMETAMANGIPTFDNPEALLKYFEDKAKASSTNELEKDLIRWNKEMARWDELMTMISNQIKAN